MTVGHSPVARGLRRGARGMAVGLGLGLLSNAFARHGSIKRVASAVGEGAMAIALVHR